MAFFTLAVKHKSIDQQALESEDEYKKMIISRIMESNAWELHKMKHRDAQVSTVAQDGGFSGIEKASGKRHEDEPAINYDSHSKNFVVGCNCGKEKFIFDTRTDKVESENMIKMKEITPYRRDDSTENSFYSQKSPSNIYGNPQGTYGGSSRPSNSYGQGPQSGYGR